MTQQDEDELHRLSTMLRSIDQQLDSRSVLREALQKAGIALSLSFIGGLRAEVEAYYEHLGKPLTDVQHAHLRSLGILESE
jgi:hypothetical protein